MKVEVISKECIKPSSPTPHALRNHKLSLLDLYTPFTYIPLVLYYHPPTPSSNAAWPGLQLLILKQSLSETLSLFYPLAGRIGDLHSIDCNDRGVYFAEARVQIPLSDFLNGFTVSSVNKLLPGEAKWNNGPFLGHYVAGVQVTTFACGGVSIGVFVSHMIADGTALSYFLKSWGAAASAKCTAAAPSFNENKEAVTPSLLLCRPKFDASSLFPLNQKDYGEESTREACTSALWKSHVAFGRYVCRRFRFDATAIADLKAGMLNSSSEAGVASSTVDFQKKCPSRVEVVTALLTKCIMTAITKTTTYHRTILLNHAVNLRRRANPQFPDGYMGNFVWMASTTLCKTDDDDHGDEAGGVQVVCQLREAMTKLNGDFVKGLQGGGGLIKYLEAIKYERETYTTDTATATKTDDGASRKIGFTSWCNLGFYEIDFGWGKPVWASVFGMDGERMSFHNGIILMDTPHPRPHGIEAWVYMREEDMAALLQLHHQLLAPATLDPNPLSLH